MARFFLHLMDFNGDLLLDEEGSELPSLAAAKDQALLAMHDLVGDAIKSGDDPRFEAIVIADEHGTHLALAPFVVAVPSKIVEILKRPDKVIRADRLAEYRRYADDALAKAENADDEDDKMSWLKLANGWLQMLPVTHSKTEVAGWPKASDDDSKASH